MTYETTSDAVLGYLADYLKTSGELPAGVQDVRMRDWSGEQSGLELVLDAEEPDEHEVLHGVEMLDGEVTLNISPDDVKSEQDRRWMLGKLENVLRHGFRKEDDSVVCFLDWLEEADAAVKVFDFKVKGAVWESEGRRLHGRVSWSAVGCLAE